MDAEARKAAVEALGRSVRDATARARAQALARGGPATITMEGQTITMLNGYPNEESIDNTLQDYTGFQYIDAVVAKFRRLDAPAPESCIVTYADAVVGSPPVITVLTTGC